MSGHAPSTRRILVADADPDARALYRRSFAPTGCDIVEAIDGRDALVKALVRVPGLIILELDLPAISGASLCEIFRADHATANVPILVVTKETRDAELERALRAGATSVITKAAPLDALIDEANRLLARESRDVRIPTDGRPAPAKAEAGTSDANPSTAPRRAS